MLLIPILGIMITVLSDNYMQNKNGKSSIEIYSLKYKRFSVELMETNNNQGL